MANGKIKFGKQAGGQLDLIIPDGASNTEVILPESGELANKEYVDAANTTGNAATATKLQTTRTINGVAFDGTANITIVDSTKAPIASPALTGVPTAPTAAKGTNTTQIATTAFVQDNAVGVKSWAFAAVGATSRISTSSPNYNSGATYEWAGVRLTLDGVAKTVNLTQYRTNCNCDCCED